MTRPDAMPAIATSTACSCGQDVHVRHNTVDWVAWCPDCYEPVEDAPASALVRGFGPTPTAALGEWHRQHEEVRPLVITASGMEALKAAERVPASTSDVIGNLARDVSIEADRQRGWHLDRVVSFRSALGAAGHLYAPWEP